jgi:arylsulfatase A-like enzyme
MKLNLKKMHINLNWSRRLIIKNKVAFSVASRVYGVVYKPYWWYQTRKANNLVASRMRSLNLRPYIDSSSHPHLNVIIITVDCLRNANLSCNGYFRKTTPFLDSIKTRFNAMTASPWTYPSVASLLTGLYPHNHGAILQGAVKNTDTDDLNSYAPLRSTVVSLPEILQYLGYRIHFYTAVELAYLPLRSRVIAHRFSGSTTAETLFRNIQSCIPRGSERHFAYVHLADLHLPLSVPKGYREFFGRDKGWQTMYDNVLRYIDASIERLFDYLSSSRLLDRTAVVITGDHGEELGEHADLESDHFFDPRGIHGFGHGHNVFREICEVPLIFAGAVHADATTNSLVSLVDVVPSILNLIGVEHKLRFDGRSVFAKTSYVAPRALLCEACGYGYETKALVVDRHKLVYSKEDGIEWVFDLEKDPQERNPITDPKVTKPLVDVLQRVLREDERLKIKEAKKRIEIRHRSG